MTFLEKGKIRINASPGICQRLKKHLSSITLSLLMTLQRQRPCMRPCMRTTALKCYPCLPPACTGECRDASRDHFPRCASNHSPLQRKVKKNSEKRRRFSRICGFQFLFCRLNGADSRFYPRHSSLPNSHPIHFTKEL